MVKKIGVRNNDYVSKDSAITLIVLVITIIVLLILVGVTISLIEKNGVFEYAKVATEETNKQTATEKMNLKITSTQMNIYAEEQRLPTLQEFADELCEDNEIEYVEVKSKIIASVAKIDVGEAQTIFTKLKEYPYEFEKNSSLQLASRDGVKIETNNTAKVGQKKYSTEETIVGSWIDNKPIYQKTYVLTDLSKNDGLFITIDENAKNYIDKFIHSEFRMTRAIENVQLASSYDYDANSHFAEIWFSNEKGLYIFGAFEYTALECHVTVQYTKVTD